MVSSEIPNVSKVREVFGSDKVMYNNSRLTKVGTVYVPLAFAELTPAYQGKQYELEFNLPDNVLNVGDILKFNHLDSQIEFEVQAEVTTQIQYTYRYRIISRGSVKYKEK